MTLQARQLPVNTQIHRWKSSAYLKISEKNTEFCFRQDGTEESRPDSSIALLRGCYRGTLENTDHGLFHQLCCVVIVHCVFPCVGALAVKCQSLPVFVFDYTAAFKTARPHKQAYCNCENIVFGMV